MQGSMGDSRKDRVVGMRGSFRKASQRGQHLNWGKAHPRQGKEVRCDGPSEDHQQFGFVWLLPRFVLVVVSSIL